MHAEQTQVGAKVTGGSGPNTSADLSSSTVAPLSTVPSTPETLRPQRALRYGAYLLVTIWRSPLIH